MPSALVVGCGRTGSAVARTLAADEWAVTCIDVDELALGRLEGWRGGFVVGHGMDTAVLEEAGVADADAVVVATSGDNSNIVIGQVIQKRWARGRVVVRVLDPARAAFYRERGLDTVCPTDVAIGALVAALRDVPRGGDA